MAEYDSPFKNYTDDDFYFVEQYNMAPEARMYNNLNSNKEDDIKNYKEDFLTCPYEDEQNIKLHTNTNINQVKYAIQRALNEYSGSEIETILPKIEALAEHSPENIKEEIVKILREQAQKEEISEEEKKKLEASAENIEKGDDDNVITVDENISEAKEDDGWKKEVREAVKKANTDLKQEFEEYKDEEHPEHLFFKDKKNDKNIIAFASKSEGYVEGEQAAFDELVKTAQNMGKETVNFGKFEKHPEYKARLYLACLKFGMKMKNAPELEALKQYPEYKEIRKLQKEKLSKELETALKNEKKIGTNIILAPEGRPLLTAWIEAKDKFISDSSAENREAYREAQEKLYAKCPDFKAALETCQRIIREINKINMEQLNDARKAHEEKKDDTSKAEYKKALEETADFYIGHGSGKERDISTPEQRIKNLNRHTKPDDEHGVIRRTSKSGQKEMHNTYAQERLVIQEVLNRRNSR